uniref:hemagglutinin/amebocyte aggregation factor-like n=1 Tax=Myxine glutinosa TaxID=7769 RepID=UPI00358FA083
MTRMIALLFGLVLLVTMGASVRINDWDGVMNYNCPPSQSISRLQSYHRNDKEDRVWDVNCKTTFGRESQPLCYETNYVNCFDEAIVFKCPPNFVISGLHSYHDNYTEDRRWRFTCCSQKGVTFNSCKWTEFLNEWDGPLKWTTPSNEFLVGVNSIHDNHKEDRRWKFQSCKMQKEE